MNMTDALQAVVGYAYPADTATMFTIILLALLFVVAAAASLFYLIRSFPRFDRLRFAIGVLLAFIAFGLFHATGDANGRYEAMRHEDLVRLRAEACPSVIEGVRSGAIKELMREDVLKIRWVCDEKAFMEAVNSEDATLDITFATGKR